MRISAEEREQLLARFQRVTAWPMLVLALAIVPIIIIPMVADLSPSQSAALTGIDWLIWAAFAIEFAIALTIAPRKLFFLRHHAIDTIVVVVPFAQPLRLLRSARVLRISRVARGGTYLARGAEEGRSLFRRESVNYVLIFSAIALVGSGILVWGVERQDGSGNIKTLPDALWWAVTTITTVGYGDKYPVTPEGRAVAVVLMFLGIALFGVITATLASFFVEHQSQSEFQQVMARLDTLEERLLGTDPVRTDEGSAEDLPSDPTIETN